MRKLWPILVTLAAFMSSALFVRQAHGLPENGTKCLLNRNNCSSGGYQPAGGLDPGCDNLGSPCNTSSKIPCTYCLNGPVSQVSICVQWYEGPGCITDDGTAPCGDEWASTCKPAPNTCLCDPFLASKTGNACAFPTCTGNY